MMGNWLMKLYFPMTSRMVVRVASGLLMTPVLDESIPTALARIRRPRGIRVLYVMYSRAGRCPAFLIVETEVDNPASQLSL
jgi:hypothetical protein